MTQELRQRDDFDGLLDDVLRSVANPEIPERVKVRTRVYVQEMVARDKAQPLSARDAGVFSPDVFLAKMRPERDAKSTAAAALLHAAAIALIFWGVKQHVQFAAPAKTTLITEVTAPPPMPVVKDVMGGGGGQRGPIPVSKGSLPKFEKIQITPPKIAVDTKVPMPPPSIEVQPDLKMATNNMPNLGNPNSPLVGSSMGNGSGSGLGLGNGSGLGPGSGGNYGGGLRRIGGGVSEPQLVYKVDPEFSEEARRAKFMGVVTVNLIVDPNGNPQNVRLVRGVGMGLDEKAIEAVRQYRFKPARENGKPVAVQLNVEVDFRIF
jgi:protein TonB